MSSPFEVVVGMSADDFFKHYWGKKPLFVKGAMDSAKGVITADDLAGLSCEVEATRLIQKSAAGWDVRYGPFDDSDFADLPENNWTLLVQEVDRMDEAVNVLLNSFRSFPNWRLDDIMVSYAAPGGSVGAHVDKYDVFLIQGEGTRRWEIGLTPLKDPPFLEDLELRILKEFVPDQVIEAEPGDLLYLPPMFAHNGVAVTECITLSVGFRKPLVSDMVASYLSEMLSRIDPEHQLVHSLEKSVEDPGLLDFDTMESVRSVFRSLLYDEESVDDWFGRYITSPKRGDGWEGDDEEQSWNPDNVAAHLSSGSGFDRIGQSLCSYQKAPGGSVRLYAVGQVFILPSGIADIARIVSGVGPITATTLGKLASNDAVCRLLARLVSIGYLQPE